MAQSVKRPTAAQVMISHSVSSSPASGSMLTAWTLEPALGSVSPSLCSSPTHALSLSLPKINNFLKSLKKKTTNRFNGKFTIKDPRYKILEMTAVSCLCCRKGQKGFNDGIFHTARTKQGQRVSSPYEAVSPLASDPQPCPLRAATLHLTPPTVVMATHQTHSVMCEFSHGKKSPGGAALPWRRA